MILADAVRGQGLVIKADIADERFLSFVLTPGTDDSHRVLVSKEQYRVERLARTQGRISTVAVKRIANIEQQNHAGI